MKNQRNTFSKHAIDLSPSFICHIYIYTHEKSTKYFFQTRYRFVPRLYMSYIYIRMKNRQNTFSKHTIDLSPSFSTQTLDWHMS